jgi:hypothetical protein
VYSILFCDEFFNNPIKKYLSWAGVPGEKAVSILDEIDRVRTSISTGEGVGGKGSELTGGNNWWRCRDLNPGHCGYESEPRESARWEHY